MSAFDTQNTPSIDLIDDCVHCGFCLPTCPTYSLWARIDKCPDLTAVALVQRLKGGLGRRPCRA